MLIKVTDQICMIYGDINIFVINLHGKDEVIKLGDTIIRFVRKWQINHLMVNLGLYIQFIW